MRSSFAIASEAVDNWTNKELGKTPPGFGGNPGEPVPQADPEDLKALWRVQRDVEVRHPGQQIFVTQRLIIVSKR